MSNQKIKTLLSECVYALGEAMTNTECAMLKEKRPDIKENFEEDYVYFSDLKKRIINVTSNMTDIKRGITDGKK